jgi:hypothetical protein
MATMRVFHLRTTMATASSSISPGELLAGASMVSALQQKIMHLLLLLLLYQCHVSRIVKTNHLTYDKDYVDRRVKIHSSI